MKTYHFTGHLNPLPPGVRLPLQLSGDVCLPSDVAAEIVAMEASREREVRLLNERIANLLKANTSLRKKLKRLRFGKGESRG